MTQNVYAQTGFLFGGLYDKELGLRKPLKVNIFDTPGFADVDIDNIRKNKILIRVQKNIKITCQKFLVQVFFVF